MLLTIESTCDETAAAVIDPEGKVLGQSIATQDELHEPFRGVVPEIAARAHVERILPVIDHAMKQAAIQADALTAIAVADRPGLAGSLLVGLVAAKSLAVAWKKPLVTLNHLHAHLYACQMVETDSVYPCVGLIVSGGHTSLYRCTSPLDLDYLGGTIDDAAGEAFDKVAAMLNLGFPGGPAVARWATRGRPDAHAFPRSMVGKKNERAINHDFSFSGLKTAVRYAIVGSGSSVDPSTIEVDDHAKADLCASFEAAVVDTLVAKCSAAVATCKVDRLIIGGGVAANQTLREQIAVAARDRGFAVTIAPMDLCTDNAAMGAIAWEKIRRGELAPLDVDITPGLQRGF